MIKKTTLCIAVLFTVLFAVSAQSDYKRHEVSLSYGIVPTSDWIDAYSSLWMGMANIKSKSDSSLGTFSLSYNYRLNQIFGIGGVFSYSRQHKDWGTAGEQKMNYYTIMPRMKAEWLHAKYFTLYSAAAIGVTRYSDDFAGDKDSKVLCAWQVSPIGIEVGNEIAGFAELGIGQLGVAQVGVRCRF